jgi:membrane protein YqaA with SNARE-associated domain
MAEQTPAGAEKTGARAWLKKRLVPISGLLLTVAIVVTIVLVYLHDPQIFDRLKGYGYAGAFVISIVLNGTIIFPVSNMALMIAIGVALPQPWLVGILGGVGAGIGELTGYLAGRSGRDIIAKNKMYTRVEGWVKKWGWLAVFLLSVIPFAFDVVGIIAGATRMPVWRFMTACWLGRTLVYTVVIYLAIAGFKALPWL